MTSGRIIKNFNGYYYVETDTGIVTCKIKGKMKQERFSAVTGDMVEFQKNPDGESMRYGGVSKKSRRRKHDNQSTAAPQFYGAPRDGKH